MFDLYAASILITMIFLIITVADMATNKLITKNNKRISILVCLFIALSALGEYLGVITNGASADYYLLHKLAKIVEFSCAPFIGVFAGIAYGDAKNSKIVLGLAGAHCIFEVIASYFGLVFTIDANNIYHRERFYAIYVIAFLLSLAYVFASIIQKSRTFQASIDSVLRLILLLLTVGIGIQFIFSDIKIDYMCITIVNLLSYIHHCKTILQVDAVTHLLNRRCFDVKITDLGSRAVIVLLDMDNFKGVNDTYGHSVGDICLKNTAQILRKVYGRYGLCYRIGGDEFSAILSTSPEKTEELNSALENELEELQKRDQRMTGLSIGYAVYYAGTSHIQTVIEEADAMLYENKSLRKQKQSISEERGDHFA